MPKPHQAVRDRTAEENPESINQLPIHLQWGRTPCGEGHDHPVNLQYKQQWVRCDGKLSAGEQISELEGSGNFLSSTGKSS